MVGFKYHATFAPCLQEAVQYDSNNTALRTEQHVVEKGLMELLVSQGKAQGRTKSSL